jgi:glycosyltransferase involved in cell wall biosynthesis
MRLVILTQYYPPETGAPQNRLSDLARRLAARGHDVQVLTALPNYPGDAVHPAYVGRENSVEEIDGVRVARVGLYVPRQKTFSRRVASYLSFAFNAARFGRRLVGSADVLFMESPPLFIALAGVPLARQLGARLVTNISDLWPASAVELGFIGRGPALYLAERLERWMYRHSDAISVQTEGIARDIQRRFPAKRVVLFPNGVDLARYDAPVNVERLREAYGWRPNQCVVGYTGVIGHAQALDQVLDAARRLQPQDDVVIALFGDGPCRGDLERRIAAERIPFVRFYAREATERMPQIQAAFDVGLVPLAKARIFEGARPSKMFELMAAAKPVLLCGRGEAADILGAAIEDAGIAVPPEDPAALAAALRRFAQNREWAAAMGLRARDRVRTAFDREQIARAIERLFLSVSRERPSVASAAAAVEASEA